MALQDFSGRMLWRVAGELQRPYWVEMALTPIRYLAVLWFSPNNFNQQHFGPMLMILSVIVTLDRIANLEVLGGASTHARRYSTMFSDKRVVLPVLLSYGIAALWLLAMPSHATVHTHIVPRIFFLPYFVLVLIFILRVFECPSMVSGDGTLTPGVEYQ